MRRQSNAGDGTGGAHDGATSGVRVRTAGGTNGPSAVVGGEAVGEAPQPAATRVGGVLALGGLMTVVDVSVVAVAATDLMRAFDADLPAVQWVTIGYALALVTGMPLAGWVATRFGPTRVYLTALLGFTLASVACAAAPGLAALVGARVAAGLAGGLLNPVGQAIALRAVPAHARGRMMSLLGLPVVVGPVLGTPLAGVLLDHGGWRWLFWINIPVGLLGLALARRVLPRFAPDPTRRPPDPMGTLLLPAGAAAITYGCTRISEHARDLMGPVLVLAGALAVAAFARRALRSDRPLLRVGLLRSRALRTGALVVGLFGTAYFGSNTVLPLLVQAGRGDSALTAAALTVPMALATGLSLQLATRAVDRMDPARVVSSGLACAAAGFALLGAAVSTDRPYPLIAAAGCVVGLGCGAVLSPTMVAATRTLTGDAVVEGTTMVQLASQIGAALGAAGTAGLATGVLNARAPALDGTGFAGLLDGSRAPGGLAGEVATSLGAAYLLPLALTLIALLLARAGLRGPAPTPDRTGDGLAAATSPRDGGHSRTEQPPHITQEESHHG